MSDGRRVRWAFGRRLRSLWRWRSAEADVREEMALHRDLRARDLEAQGLSPDAARRRAAREVGRPEDVAPVVARLARTADRRTALGQWMDELRQDIAYAVRSARRSAGFTMLVVLTIALGLGGNTAIFGVVNVALLQPLPFDPHNTLVRVREFRQAPDGSVVHVDASRRTADAVAERPDLFSASVALSGSGRALARTDGAIRVAGMRVGPGFTSVVGVTPIVGRTFTREEELAGERGGAVLLSYRLWQAAFGGDRSIVGTDLRLDGQTFAVVGVLPVNFAIPYGTDLWFPSAFGENERGVFILARLAAGVSIPQVRAALEPVAEDLNRRYPDALKGLGITAVSAREYFTNNQAELSLVLMGAVGLLLLIGCSNVALLLTTKFASRQSEIAMRAALGCSRARQVRQFVTEGVLLFAAGGSLGFAVALSLREWLVALLPEVLATEVGFQGIPLDWPLVAFAMGLSLTTGIAFGLLAALRTTGTDLLAVMKDGGRSVAGASSRGTLGGLAVAEVALALVLLFSAGVVADTFWRLSSRDMGFDITNVMTLRLDLDGRQYDSPDARRLFLARALERIRQVPGVATAGATSVNPLCCGDWGARVTPEGHVASTPEQTPIVQHFIVTPGYFATLRQRVIEGRDFTAADAAGAAPVVIVDQATARRFWPGSSAIGKRIKRGMADDTSPWLTIVGVVEPAVEAGEYPESWYLPFAQNPSVASAENAHLMVRASANVMDLAPAIRAVVAEIDPALAVYGIATMPSLLDDRLQQPRLGAWVSGVFAGAGLLLAALGLYGVLSFVVAGDRKEIAVRLALGASTRDVLSLIAGRGLRLACIGLAAGTAASWGVSRVLPMLVTSAEPDMRMLAVAAALLLLPAVVAVAVPARRALRLDPTEVLRG